ncbi:MAG: hypothetical protein Q9174_006212 [Haloplaca sp. 1 TL-2023]
MQTLSQITVLIFALLLVISTNFCDARPHAHGVFERLRHYAHAPTTTSHKGHHSAFTQSVDPALPSISNAIPALGDGTDTPGADFNHANASIAAPLRLQPTPKPLALVLQDAHPIDHQQLHSVGHRHEVYSQHANKHNDPALAALETNLTADTSASEAVVGTTEPTQTHTHVIRQVNAASSTSVTSAVSSLPTALCPSNNGTVFKSSSGITYQAICNLVPVDLPIGRHNVGSYEACILECDIYNYNTHGTDCTAIVFARADYKDENCHLYSSVTRSMSMNEKFEMAIRYSIAQASQVTASGSATSSSSLRSSTSSSTSSGSSSRSSTSTSRSPSASAAVSPPGVTYGTGRNVVTPRVSGSKLHGPSQNRPTTQYIQFDQAQGVNLAKSLLRPGVNGDLSTGYEISPQTGILDVNIYTQNALAPLKSTPHISRDGGRGGYLNGQHLFLFSDTGSYSGPTLALNGDFLDFVSSSVAVDVGMNGLRGQPLTLQDGIGEWSDNVGRQRGFAPLTQGEQAYNVAMQGNGQRYAVWIESSIIPLDATTGLIYGPIIYDDVDLVTRDAVFTYTGTTLLTITAGGRGGPVAQRPVRKIFYQDEPEWGVNGGLRSWGPSGIGGTDGKVYLFGGVPGGQLLARVAADSIENRDAYQYWTGDSWTTIMPGRDSKAFFIEGPIMDLDIFYSPRHMTFIAVYLTNYADSTFYYRYLEADRAIMPSYAPGGDPNVDCAEYLLRYDWSEEQVLYKAQPGLSGAFIYSGGVHLQYFGSDDISNGGSRMLLSWTSPTGQNPGSLNAEYQIVTAEVNLE